MLQNNPVLAPPRSNHSRAVHYGNFVLINFIIKIHRDGRSFYPCLFFHVKWSDIIDVAIQASTTPGWLGTYTV